MNNEYYNYYNLTVNYIIFCKSFDPFVKIVCLQNYCVIIFSRIVLSPLTFENLM
jgi:hypothetical protein